MADYEPDYRGLGDILTGPAMYASLAPTAAGILARAEALAAPHVRTGHYAASFRVERARAHDRAYLQVVNTDPAAAPIEADQHILGRAVG